MLKLCGSVNYVSKYGFKELLPFILGYLCTDLHHCLYKIIKYYTFSLCSNLNMYDL